MLNSTFLGIVPILFGLCTAPVKDVPKHNVNGNGIYSLYGCYCYRDSFDSPVLQTLDVDYSFIDYTSSYEARVSFYAYYDDYVVNTVIRTFEISLVNNVWHIDLFEGEYTLDEDISYGDYLTDLHDESAQLVLFFPTPYNVTENAYKIFNAIYTSEGNDFVTNYSGWYTITNTNVSLWYNINGFFIVDNNSYNNIYYRDYNCTAYLDTDVLTVVDNKKLMVSSAILFNNVLIARYQRDELIRGGVFNYVYEPVEYTFGEMIFSVVDAPIYMLSQLFSFELFDIQFYVAFMGIVTVVLICFVLKKII